LTLKRNIILAGFLLPFFAFAQSFNNIEFIENKGQWDDRVKFTGAVDGGAFFIRSKGFTVLQHNKADLNSIFETMHGHHHGPALTGAQATSPGQSMVLRSHAYNVDFINASPDMEVVPDKLINTYNNYFLGNDPAKWASNCRIYLGITLKNVYPHIDVRYYTDNGYLKYDIIAHPGANISQIALKYEGTDKLTVKNKELVVATSIGELKESAPYTYQSDAKGKTEVGCRYVIRDNVVRFEVKEYNPNATLVIDPTMIFCSFSGSAANNWGFTATYGIDGSMYGGGIVFTNGFPVSPGAFQTTYQGGATGSQTPVDIGIIKLSPDGSSRVYATYIGGGGDEQPHSLVVDAAGNLIVAGRSNSPNYPLRGSTAGSGPGGSFDIVITKLNATGTDLIGSRKIGGSGDDGVNIKPTRSGQSSLEQNYGDDGRSEVILDAAGNIYVASSTQSTSDFPVTSSAFQQSFGGGGQDGAVLKLTPNLAISFISYLGGSANDAAYVLALRPGSNEIYVAGGTESSSFPGPHGGTVGPTYGGSIDGYVAQISNNGSTLIRSTYIGTSSLDQVYGVQFDRLGFPYIMGQTRGSFQVRNAAYSNSGGKQFIAKLQPDLSGWVYSTVFGTGSVLPNISPVAFLVDRCENVYVSGWGGLINPQRTNYYPNAGTSGLPVTPDANKPTTDNADFYFFVLKKNASDILYGSFFGQNGGLADHVDGGTSRFDVNGVIFQGVCANCSGGAVFPTTPGAWATTRPSSANCNLAMVKMAFNLAGVGSDIQSMIGGVPRDSAGCVPLTVDFYDSIRNAVSYEWYFNYVPGSPPDDITTVPVNQHTYNATGNYLVMLVAIDPNTCNVRDSSFVNIRVGANRADLALSYTKLNPCDSFRYQFNNLSSPPLGPPFGAQSFVWDFGDGTPPVIMGNGSIIHNFPGAGTYNVTLTLQDTAYCNAPETIDTTISVAELVKARFTTPAFGCVPYDAVFNSSGTIAGERFWWDFGDGSTSDLPNPTHLYTVAGTYDIVMVAYNDNTCNKTDTARFRITVYDKPVAFFTHAPVPPQVNTPSVFTNLSSPDAVRFRWNFGDGDSLITNSRMPVSHQFNATDTFIVCLTAYNQVGCDSTYCEPVAALIDPLLDVPNAFTPLSGGVNSIVKVMGFGISKIQFTIYNRWGQKVFETNNRHQGWDGKVKGVVQPMDVYVYTLSVEFFDGTKTVKKGDITLIR
jgi:gliding motility-associated-like protein